VGADGNVRATSGVMARVAVVMSGFPRLSETFALNELLALRRRGMLAAVFATKPGDGKDPQPQVSELGEVVTVLPDGEVDRQADAVVDRLTGAGVDGVHGYFAHQPAAVAAAAAARLGVPYGFGAHALDVRKVEPAVLTDRARRARGVVTCNRDTARALAGVGVRARLLPHGVDVARFTPVSDRPAAGPLRVLSVGRLVEKKGIHVALAALAELDGSVVLRIVGGGGDECRLHRDAERRGLGARVEFAGPRTHLDLPAEYAHSEVVVVPSVIDARGDRDGLPNVVLEAMASGVAVVASDVASVSDAVVHGVTGLLVPPDRPEALAAALRRLGDDPPLRRRLGAAGRRRAVAEYDLTACSAALCSHLEALYG
jgi:glycosyltransferase involved in cell wall biosynthesis